jgi:hypothetical protein
MSDGPVVNAEWTQMSCNECKWWKRANGSERVNVANVNECDLCQGLLQTRTEEQKQAYEEWEQ